jgi:hypothetical protein
MIDVKSICAFVRAMLPVLASLRSRLFVLAVAQLDPRVRAVMA